jgi:alkylation response protein AidB-like acyl-CoA dehydrogenase
MLSKRMEMQMKANTTVTSRSDITPFALGSEFLRAQDYYNMFSRFLREGDREFWTSVLAPQSVEGIHLRSGPGCNCASCKVRIRREAWINERTVPAERHDQVVTLAGQLGDEFATRAAEHDCDNTFASENLARLKETGYSALVLPERFGGLGGNLETLVRAQERLAQGCAATAIAINMHLFTLGSMYECANHSAIEAAFFSAIGHGRQIIAGAQTEPGGSGGWKERYETEIEKVGDRCVLLRGLKRFTSMAEHADVFLIVATLVDKSPLTNAVAVVPRRMPGLRVIKDSWDSLGMRAAGNCDLQFDAVVLPAKAIIDPREAGVIDSMAISSYAWFDLSIAAVYTGVAIAARDWAKAFARNHRTSGAARSIAYLPGSQFAFAEAEALIAQSRALYLGVAADYVRDRDSFQGESGWARIAMTKYVATNNAIRVVDLLLEVVGSEAMLRKNPMQRYFRDVRAGLNHTISNARARELIGKAALGISVHELPRW